jgi:nitrogen fixation protein FixH
MKFHWGIGIAIFYTLFALAMVAMVMYSRTLDNSLVVDNYYDKDLQYQSHIDKVQNSNSLNEDLVIQIDLKTKMLHLKFPSQFRQIQGQIQFYRADDSRKDVQVKLEVGSGNVMQFPLKNLAAGKWTLKVDWTGDGTPFYKQQDALF